MFHSFYCVCINKYQQHSLLTTQLLMTYMQLGQSLESTEPSHYYTYTLPYHVATNYHATHNSTIPRFSLQTYHNGRIDIPTDEDLHNVANEVAVRLKEEWLVLQSYLEIPDHIMLDVLHQRTIWQQVFRQVGQATVPLHVAQQQCKYKCLGRQGKWGRATVPP